MTEVQTQRLVIRSFTPDDWRGLQSLAIDKEHRRRDPDDLPWPTSDDACKEFAEYLARMPDAFFAVCLKRDRKLIGPLAFNRVEENRRLELGYQVHSEYQRNDVVREALDGIIEFAFEHKNVRFLDTGTNPDWKEQIVPLESLGFAPVEGDRGHLGITREDWRKRGTQPS